MSELKIAVAGAGAIGRRHMELIAQSPECALCAIVDPAPGAVETARKAGVPLHGSLAELFVHQRPDGVIIGTPNPLHVENALDCIAAGVAALVEKPVAQTLPGYEVASRLAVFAPIGTPPAIIARLNREIVRVVNLPEVKSKFHESQIEVVGDTPEALAAMIKAEIATTARVIKEAGIRAE